MAEAYTWKVTLADNSVKQEVNGDKFNLSWETPGAIKKIELIGAKVMSCNLETGEFNINGELISPSGSSGSKKLYFRKRRQIRTDGHNLLDTRTKYILGYTINGKEFLASIQPPIGMLPEEISKPILAPIPLVKSLTNFKEELIALKGIGPKTVDQILLMASSKEELIKIPKGRLIRALRDDVIPILDKYLGR